MPREYSRHTLPKWHKDWQRPDYLYHMRPPTMPQNRFNIIFERFKTHDITDYRELAYFFGVAAAEEALLDEQAPPESDVAGNTVMTFAAACGRVKTIELLLRYGAKVDATNKCGNQPVHLACVGGSVEALRTLRYAGADLDARGLENHRSTPLHVACLHALGAQRERAEPCRASEAAEPGLRSSVRDRAQPSLVESAGVSTALN